MKLFKLIQAFLPFYSHFEESLLLSLVELSKAILHIALRTDNYDMMSETIKVLDSLEVTTLFDNSIITNCRDKVDFYEDFRRGYRELPAIPIFSTPTEISNVTLGRLMETTKKLPLNSSSRYKLKEVWRMDPLVGAEAYSLGGLNDEFSQEELISFFYDNLSKQIGILIIEESNTNLWMVLFTDQKVSVTNTIQFSLVEDS